MFNFGFSNIANTQNLRKKVFHIKTNCHSLRDVGRRLVCTTAKRLVSVSNLDIFSIILVLLGKRFLADRGMI